MEDPPRYHLVYLTARENRWLEATRTAMLKREENTTSTQWVSPEPIERLRCRAIRETY